MLISQSSY